MGLGSVLFWWVKLLHWQRWVKTKFKYSTSVFFFGFHLLRISHVAVLNLKYTSINEKKKPHG